MRLAVLAVGWPKANYAVADVFLKAAQPAVAPSANKARATTVEELRANLASHPRAISLAQLELDTMGEDWLLALQDELTKPYFLSVRGRLSHASIRADTLS